MSNYPYLKPQKKKRGGLFKILLIIFLGISVFGFNRFIRGKTTTNSSNIKGVQIKSNLKNITEKAMEEAKGTYGIAVENFKTGEKYYADENKIFKAGSLYKLWVMATVYKQIQNGQLSKDEVLSMDIATLNQKFNINPEDAEQTEGTITLSVYDALYQMITISHNYAALLLSDKVKLSSVSTFLKENGFTNSFTGTDNNSPVTTAFDIALFFKKLYKGELANKQYTDEMINLLLNQKLKEGLPKYLPDKSKVANKTGNIEFFEHDGGIVFTDKGDYTVTILSESDFPSGAQERIALISKTVFDYFTNNP